jgi:hypothetical protein
MLVRLRCVRHDEPAYFPGDIVKLRLTVAILAVVAAAAHAQQAALADLAARIEYAFYVRDARDLTQAVTELAAADDTQSSALHLSWLNYGRWKLAQLSLSSQPAIAEQMAEQCANQNWPAWLDAATAAIASGLRAACDDLLGELRPVRGVWYRHERDKQLAQALATGTQSPQVSLIAGWLLLRQENANAAYPRLQQGMRLYDAAERSGQLRNDNWGQAELSYLLGKMELDRGQALAARNNLERALIQVADYRDAADLLKTLSMK